MGRSSHIAFPVVARIAGVALLLGLAQPYVVTAQGLADPARAKGLDKCHIILERTGAKLAVKKLKSLGKCSDGVLKCLQTKPGVPRCLEQARERCDEQLRAGAAETAKLVDAVVRKCGSDLEVGDLLAPAGLDVESLRTECSTRFGIAVDDLAGVGNCLARQHACELERMFAVAAPRAATLLAVAGVDGATRSALTCLPDHGGSDEHVADPRNVGRPVERCSRAVENAALKLADASLKSIGRCLDTLFTCAQVKNDPATAPACIDKATKRCTLELANLAAAATRPSGAIASACDSIDYATLQAAEGLRLGVLEAECNTVGAPAPTTLGAYVECLTRSQRCGVAALARFKSPRADALLAGIGQSLNASLCPALAPTPTPTTTPSATAATPTSTPLSPTATVTPTPGCPDAFEPSSFPDGPVDVSGQCNGGCTDDGFDLAVAGNIDVESDGDFYVLDVTDLANHTFALRARLEDIPDGNDYDLYLYRLEGTTFVEVDASTNDGTGSEAVAYDGDPGDNSGRYGIEIRRIAGTSCTSYRLELSNPS